MTSEVLQEVPMSARSADSASSAPYAGLTPIEELIRRMEKPPMTFEEAVATAPDVFESDEEYEEFLTWYRAERQRQVV
ncbi:hypothetical protein [Actinoplanes philippinensis]|uniref:hypothetical protein n=1 Tax=Actinoplanes philippinensis TaxID=35752 RepID=UPI0033CB8D6D